MEAWKTVNLGDICGFRRGLTYKKTDEVASSRNAVLRANNITLGTGELDLDEIRYIREDIEIPESKMVTSNCLLVCTASGSKSHLGKIALIEEGMDFAFGGFMGLLVPSSQVVPKYLFWLTRSDFYADFIARLSDGANINNLKWSQLSQFVVPIPPLPEQKRIVAILDEAFAAIATATANAEKNLANARELFESILELKVTDTTDGWRTRELKEDVRFIDYRGRTPHKTAKGMRLITAKNVKMGVVQQEPREYVDPKDYDAWMVRGIPCEGDVLFTTEAPLGNVAQLDTAEKVVFAQRIITLQPDRNIIDPTMLHYVLRSSTVQRRIQENATGATATGIKASLLKKITIALPGDVKLQGQLANELSEAEATCRRIATQQEQKVLMHSELKQSILHKAFTGELTSDFDHDIAKVAS